MSSASATTKLIASIIGDRTEDLLATLDLDAALAHDQDAQTVSRVSFATALNAVLFDQLLARANRCRLRAQPKSQLGEVERDWFWMNSGVVSCFIKRG